MAYRRRQQPPPMNSGITEDEKVMLVVEEEGKQIHVNDYTAAAAAFKSKATRSISTTTAATSPSSAFYSSSNSSSSSSTTATSLAAKAIRASSAAHTHRDSSLSSAYAHRHPVSTHTSSTSSSFSASISDRTAPSPSKGWDWGSQSSKPSDGEQASIRRNLNEAKHQQQPQGFWGNLARKAKTLLDVDEDEDNPLPSPPQRQQQRQHHHIPLTATKPRYQNSNPNYESHQKKENPTLQKSLNAISSSLSYIGNAVEEGLTVVENRTAGIIQETRKHIKSKSTESTANSQRADHRSMRQPSQRQMQMPPQMETDIELQLKASRDVAMAMAAKAKLLLRELKTVKADLAFAKERSAQLEDENKILRENRERGDNPEDDDLIRLQLETLLAEKARLAHENSVYARENRFLREVVEYHQLTMQDVVYLDEGTEEVTEVYPVKVVSNSHAVNTPSPPLPTESSVDSGLQVTWEISPRPVPPPGLLELTQSAATTSSYTPTTVAVDTRRHLNPSV